MNKYTKQDILRIVEEEEIQFIRLQFTDVFGMLKNVAITVKQLESALDNKCLFDGSSIEGFVRIEESDMYLYPDLNTFLVLPWTPKEGKVARFMCDVYRPEGIPFEGDCRYILKKVLKKAARMGVTFHVGPECEFFLFHTDDHGLPTRISHEKAGYFDVTPLDLGENARNEMVFTLEKAGIEVEASHHEVAPAQHEIDLKYDNPLRTADNLQTFKMFVKIIAKQQNLYATFMPKPLEKQDGSGLHLNMSLSKEGRNLFFDKTDVNGLSKECYYFIGGLLKHAKAMSCICNPLVNSYKRLTPGYEAPTTVAWSMMNRSPLIRIPASRGAGTRIELRSPDPAANPYLALALCLAAGLDGIQNQIQPAQAIDQNIYLLSEEEIKAMGIEKLPTTLGAACDSMEEDTFIKEVLGEHIYRKYLKAKRREWQNYIQSVSQWEIDEYLYKF